MKKTRLIMAVLAVIVVAAMLAGCMAGISEIKVNSDGSGSVTMKMGYTLEAINSLYEDESGETTEPDLSQYDVFEYNGVEYYGTIVEKTFANAEEFNTMTWYEDTMAEISESEDGSTNDRPMLKVNEDGSIELSIVLSGNIEDEEASDAESDTSEDVELTQEEIDEINAAAEEMLANMAFVMTFEMPAPVRQIEGKTEGVTIEGSVLTLNFMEMTAEDEDVLYKFTTAEAPAETAPAVVPSSQSITVDGETVELEVYNIDGYNYFKLRDMAMLLNGSDSQFEIAYNEETGEIDVTTGEPYTPVGGELETGTDKSASCVKSSQSVAVNGEKAYVEAYNLGGNNFFKLRDLGAAVGFGVDYNEETFEVVITTAQAE
ncbi:MAG: hypothetical protein IKD89_02070 [Clostridia bacterium]|nr:hypothetical protein [Clostridia bacterium]